MDRQSDKDTGQVQAQYNVPAERIINDARGADSLIVLAVKGGKPQLWATDKPDGAQEFLSQYFPEAVLPETTGFMAGAGAGDRSRR
jgi:hypothetical protein